jgi:hypothetical protein
MKKWLFKLLFFLLISGFSIDSFAQNKTVSQAQKRKEKVEKSYKKAYAKARKRTIKHRREIQTDATRERMDAADQRAKTYNEQNEPGFIERYFKKKRPGKR